MVPVKRKNSRPVGGKPPGPGKLQREAGISSAGFTLVELLVATMILSAVVYLAMLSYSQFLRIWGKKNFSCVRVIRAYRTDMLVRSALESIYDYYVTDPNSERTDRHYYPLFRGRKNQMEFVTLASVFKKGLPAVARLRIERQNKESKKLFRLVYDEKPLDKTYVKYVGQLPEYRHSLELYAGVKKFHLRYYGKLRRQWNPEDREFETIYGWQDDFDGADKNTIPQLIELTFSTAQEEKTIFFAVREHNAFKNSYFMPIQ